MLTNFKEIEIKLQSRYSFQQFSVGFTCSIKGTNTFKNWPPTEIHD